ncbi:ATP-binding protein [Elusimicrobiota bacterium]
MLIKIITTALIVLGAVIMLLSIFNTKDILSMLKKRKYYLTWKVLISMMIFFLFGYLAVTVCVFLDRIQIIVILIGMIFLFGSLFVLMITKLTNNTIRDILSIEKELEQALKTSETILDQLPIGMVIVGRDKKIRRINEAALRMMGNVPEKDIVGLGCHKHICPADIDQCPIFDLGKTVDNSEKILLGKNGKKIPILKTVLTINIGGEDVLLETFMDITDQKKAKDDLNRIVKELENSNKELEQFAYVASHDLKEPLRMISSYLQLIEKRYTDKLDESAKEYIGFAVSGAARMSALVSDLLEFSQIETGGKEFESINTNAVLDDVLISLKGLIEEKKAKVEYKALPAITCDESQVGRLFQNLISNAIKFCDKKIPVINISAIKENDELIFSVKDNGIGINPEYKDQIFEMFQRLHTDSDYPGTGIGLAVCKRIAIRHNGRIWVESEFGKGSIFYFAIPNRIENNRDIQNI